MTFEIAPSPEDEHHDVSLPESGWDLHIGRGPGLRPALELHTDHALIDVAVAGGRDAPLLRGAMRGRGPGGHWALAWGHLPPGDDEVVVEFTARRGARRVAAVRIAGAFWVAETPGGFRSVNVAARAARSTARLHRHRPLPRRTLGRG